MILPHPNPSPNTRHAYVSHDTSRPHPHLFFTTFLSRKHTFPRFTPQLVATNHNAALSPTSAVPHPTLASFASFAPTTCRQFTTPPPSALQQRHNTPSGNASPSGSPRLYHEPTALSSSSPLPTRHHPITAVATPPRSRCQPCSSAAGCRMHGLDPDCRLSPCRAAAQAGQIPQPRRARSRPEFGAHEVHGATEGCIADREALVRAADAARALAE